MQLEPFLSDHLKCKSKVVANGRWSCTGGQITAVLNLKLYEPVIISICKGPISTKYCIIEVKMQRTNFSLDLYYNTVNLRRQRHWNVSRLLGVKTTEKFKSPCSVKSSRCRVWEVSTVVIWLKKIWCFGKMVARGGLTVFRSMAIQKIMVQFCLKLLY